MAPSVRVPGAVDLHTTAWVGLAVAVFLAGATLAAYGALPRRPTDLGAPTPQAP